MYNYKQKKELADDKLAFYGQPVQLIRYDMNNEDPSNMTEVVLDDTILAIFSQAKEENLPGSLVGQSVGMFTCTAAKNLYDIDLYMKWNEKTYKIKYVSVTNLTNEAVIVQVYVLTSGG